MLIVDDEVALLTTLQDFFERRGYLVWTATSGEAALELITQHQPHVVLLDLRLGWSRLQGLDVLRQLKAQQPSLIVLVCSGTTDAATKTEAFALGAKEFFEKPLNLSALLRTIQENVPGTFSAGGGA